MCVKVLFFVFFRRWKDAAQVLPMALGIPGMVNRRCPSEVFSRFGPEYFCGQCGRRGYGSRKAVPVPGIFVGIFQVAETVRSLCVLAAGLQANRTLLVP